MTDVMEVESGVRQEWASGQRDRAAELMRNPRYSEVGKSMERLAGFFGREGWNFKRLLELQGKLVSELAEMGDWGEEDIRALETIKQKLFDTNDEFKRGFAKKQLKGGMTPEVWWAGFVGEAVFKRAWFRAGLYIADRGEARVVAEHDEELDKQGVDFVTVVDYSTADFDQDERYQVYVSMKTKMDMRPGEVQVVRLDEQVDPRLKSYFRSRTPEDLRQAVDDDADYDSEAAILFVLLGRGKNDDWQEMMRQGRSDEFALDLADKVDDAIRNEEALIPMETSGGDYWREVFGDEPVGLGRGKRVPVGEGGHKKYKEFARGFNTSADTDD